LPNSGSSRTLREIANTAAQEFNIQTIALFNHQTKSCLLTLSVIRGEIMLSQ